MIKKFLQKIFKIVSYGIFFKIYGKVEKSINTKTDERINVKTVQADKDLSYRIFNISNGRLYTDRIQDTAILIDNKIIEEPSFQLRHTYDSKIFNSNIKENIVFKKGTPRKLRDFNGRVLSLLTGGGGNNNYWHWLFDVLPRFSLCSKIFNLNDVDYFLLPDHIKKFQIETLDCLNIPLHKRLSSKKFRHIKAKELVVTDHPVMISGNATRDIMNMPVWISKWLKEAFVNQAEASDVKKIEKIYIDRNDDALKKTPQRFISNEDEVKKYLLEKNYTFIKLHNLKFIDQVQLFANAESIVGLHGGGFANIAFCKAKTKVIELRSSDSGTPIENLALKNDLNYNSVTVEAKKTDNFQFPNQQGSIHIPINNLSKLIES